MIGTSCGRFERQRVQEGDVPGLDALRRRSCVTSTAVMLDSASSAIFIVFASASKAIGAVVWPSKVSVKVPPVAWCWIRCTSYVARDAVGRRDDLHLAVADDLADDERVVEEADVGVELLDQRVGAAVVEEGVVALAAGDGVVAESAVQDVVERRADEAVVAVAADQRQRDLVRPRDPSSGFEAPRPEASRTSSPRPESIVRLSPSPRTLWRSVTT